MTFNKLLQLFDWLFLPKKLYGVTDTLKKVSGLSLISPALGATAGALGAADLLTGVPSQPTSPDYVGAAEATARGSKVDQYTPWGSSVYAPIEGEQGRYRQDITLTPGQQELFNLGQTTDITQAQTGLAGLEAAKGMFETPYTGLETPMGDYGSQRQSIMDAMTARTKTDVARAREAKRGELVAQGIPVGSEAYNREMEQLDRRLTDALQQAELASTQQVGELQGQDIQSRRQQIAEMLQKRQTPLNELAAFRSGTQVDMPQFPSTPLGPDYLGAEQAKGQWDLAGWNADVAQKNALTQGLFGLGAAFLGA